PAGVKWDGVAVARGIDGCPILGGTLAVFECALEATHDGGDHLIFIGRVQRMRAATEGRPLLFSRGAYRALGPALGAPSGEPAPHSTSALDSSGMLEGLEPWPS